MLNAECRLKNSTIHAPNSAFIINNMHNCCKAGQKKHPCPDCHFCQFCAEIRCIACRRKKQNPKLTTEQQIDRFEEINRDRRNPQEPIYFEE